MYAEFLNHPPGVCTVVDGVDRANPGGGTKGSASCNRENTHGCCREDGGLDRGDGGEGEHGSHRRKGTNAEDDAEGEGAASLGDHVSENGETALPLACRLVIMFATVAVQDVFGAAWG